MVQKAYRVKIMREKHTGQDLGKTLIFTYTHRRDYLIDNKHQREVDATVSNILQ